MDLKITKFNKKEMDDYVSVMLLELEKQEKELKEKEKRLKEMDAPRLTYTEPDVVTSLNVNIMEENDNEEIDVNNRDPFQTFDELLNCYSKDDNKPQPHIGFGNEGEEYEERKKILSEIRKAEYNAYLKKKEKIELKKKKELMNPLRVFPPKLIVSHNRILEENKNRHFNVSNCADDSQQPLVSTKLSDLDTKLNSPILVEYQNNAFEIVRPPSSVQSNSQASYKSSTSKKTDDRSLISVRSFGRRKSSLTSNAENSDIRHEIAALYKEQLDKQVEEKQKLKSLQTDYAERCERKKEICAMQQSMKVQTECAEELKRRDKLKEVFHIQEERCKKLEDFVRKDNELRKKMFLKYVSETNKENIRDHILEIDNSKISTQKSSSMSEELSSLSDIRQHALRTQKLGFTQNKENIQNPIPEKENLKISTQKTSSMSEVLSSLSDVRHNALRTQKLRFTQNKENIRDPIPEIENLKISTQKTSSMSEVLNSLSDVRRNALRTQKLLDQQRNYKKN